MKTIKLIATLLCIISMIALSFYGGTISYKLFYEKQVKQTIIELVKKDSLK